MSYQIRVTVHHALGIFSGVLTQDEDNTHEYLQQQALDLLAVMGQIESMTLIGDGGESICIQKKILSESIVAVKVEDEGDLCIDKTSNYMLK